MLSSHSQHWSLTGVKRSFSLVLLSGIVTSIGAVMTLPALADEVVVRGGSVTVQVGEFDRPRAVYSRDRDWVDRRPRRGHRNEIDDSILINPVIIDSSIEDSVLIDPVIVNSPRYNSSGYYNSNRIYSTGGTRPTCQVLSNFRAACN